MNDRFNTIAGWVLGGGIVLLGGMLVAGEMFSSHSDVKGYPIEGVVEEGSGAAKAEQPIAALLANADAGRGEQAFKPCATCHTITQGGAAGAGPNLWGIMGQPVASRGFAYSEALTGKGGTWDWEQMSEWLRSPSRYAPGTKMSFAGIGDAETRADLLVYLNNQGSNLPLPAAPAAAPPAEGGAAKAAAPANGAAPASANGATATNGAAPANGAQAKGGGEAKQTPR